MKIKIGYDACFAVNNYRGMGVYVNALRNVLLEYKNLEVLGVCNCNTNDKGVQQIGVKPYPLWEQLSLPLYLLKNKNDFFFFPYNTMPFFLPRSFKKILVLHDVIFLEKIPGAEYSLKQWAGMTYRKLLVANAYKKADMIITVSEYSKRRMQELLGKKEKIYVIPSLIKDELREEGIANQQEKYFLTVGGEAPSKNIFSLVRAYALLPKEILATYKLKLVGNYSEGFIKRVNSFIKKYPIEPGSVEFTGYISNQELISLYKGCALLVFPSLYEGFGLPAIEAMIFEKPLVASNTSSIPEVAGEAALYFDPLSITDIKDKIVFALSDGFTFEQYRKHYKTQLEKYTYTAFRNNMKRFVETEILATK